MTWEGKNRDGQNKKTHRGIKREKKKKEPDRRLFIIVKLQTDEVEGRNTQDDGLSLLPTKKKAWKVDEAQKKKRRQEEKRN